MESKGVKPALVIREGRTDVRPGELFGVGSVRVVLETGMDESPFILSKERCCVWIVVDEEVGDKSNRDGEKALLERCQLRFRNRMLNLVPR